MGPAEAEGGRRPTGGCGAGCRPPRLSSQPPQDKEPRGIIPLENLSIREVEDSKKPVSTCGERGGGVVQLFTEQDSAEGTEKTQQRRLRALG